MDGSIGNHMRVLLVEDAASLRYAFGRLLKLYGFEVCEAVDGREGLDAVSAFDPHLILTDLMMPVMDGVEMIRQIRADPARAHVPIVAITADATETAEAAAREAGAIDVITKPIDLPSLLERLRALEVLDGPSIASAAAPAEALHARDQK